MKQAAKDVIRWRRAVGLPVGELPTPPTMTDGVSDINCVREEYNEFMDAVASGDVAEIADGGIDLCYAVLGYLAKRGIDPAPVWDEVQKANMAKVGGPKSPDGKALKPPGWIPPDIKGVLATQAPLSRTYRNERAFFCSKRQSDWSKCEGLFPSRGSAVAAGIDIYGDSATFYVGVGTYDYDNHALMSISDIEQHLGEDQ